jgi:hypothetical protein
MADSVNKGTWLAQVRESAQKVAGNMWKERRWTEYVKNVAWELKKDSDVDDIADAVAGLVKYGITNEKGLKAAANNKKDFRDAFVNVGVLATICDKLYDDYIETRVEDQDSESKPRKRHGSTEPVSDTVPDALMQLKQSSTGYESQSKDMAYLVPRSLGFTWNETQLQIDLRRIKESSFG